MSNLPDDPTPASPTAATEPGRQDWIAGDRRTRVTPLDVRQARFRTVFRGLDPLEVTAFLTEVAGDYEQVAREADRLRYELTRVDAALEEHREQEQTLRHTLTTAQKVADDLRDTANGEAARILREAESRAALLLDRTQARLDGLERQIDELRLKRRDVETTIDATIGSLRHALDYVRELDRRDDDTRAPHRPRADAAQVEELRTELEAFRKQGGELRTFEG